MNAIDASMRYPAPIAGDFVIPNFRFNSAATLDPVRIHYQTLGQPRPDVQGVVRNAVLILHGTTGQGANFLNDLFAGELFGPGQPLDANHYYLILPDNLGHGQSSKPSDGLRARFPRYGYHDMVAAQHRLLIERLRVNHLRLIIGTSMGGMHTWLWGQIYPNFMDALLPLASLPGQISGRNRMWRKLACDAIRSDSTWNNGDYVEQPRNLRFAAGLLYLMGGNPLLRQQQAPTFAAADAVFDAAIADSLDRLDANDVLYALDASHDYDPAPGLERIKAPLLAINFADDLINPPELGILEREIQRVQRGKAITIPLSDATVGHGTHTKAAVWKEHLMQFMTETER
jgi:homoserine O-acetyltransferase/O-succinyltransferase